MEPDTGHPPGSACDPPVPGDCGPDLSGVTGQTRGWETRDQGCNPMEAPSQRYHGISSLPSRPAQRGDAAGTRGTEVHAPASPWAAARRGGREPGRGPRSIPGLQTPSLCVCRALPTSERTFQTQPQENQTNPSLKSLSRSITLKTALSLG